MALEKTLVLGTKEHVHMVIPLHLFDHLKSKVQSVDLKAASFDALPDEQKNIVMSWMSEVEDILRPDLEEFFRELFTAMYERWDEEDADIERNPQ